MNTTKQSSEEKYSKILDFFAEEETPNQIAWGIIHDFYHEILRYMDANKITQADLSRALGISRSAVSKMFKETPNVTLKRIAEITSALDLEFKVKIDRPVEIVEDIAENWQAITETSNPAVASYSHVSEESSTGFQSDQQPIVFVINNNPEQSGWLPQANLPVVLHGLVRS